MNATVKAYKGMGMEGSTARWYDRTTRKDLVSGGTHCRGHPIVGAGARSSPRPGISLD
jgi:hypothetical protein